MTTADLLFLLFACFVTLFTFVIVGIAILDAE